MKFSILFESLILLAVTTFASAHPVIAGESTMPDSYVENVAPETAAKYVYTEDGQYTKSLNIPTYEWMPTARRKR